MRGGKAYDEEGREVPGGGKGYRYFGRARELPGVKELFEARARPKEEKALETRADLRMKVDAGYYGYNLDEEDGTLVAYERAKEEEARTTLVEGKGEERGGDKAWEPLPGDVGDGVVWSLPGLEDVQEELVDRRRRRLLDKLG